MAIGTRLVFGLWIWIGIGTWSKSRAFVSFRQPQPKQQGSSSESTLFLSTTQSPPSVPDEAFYYSRERMDPLLRHPSLASLDLETRPRKKLKPRHKAYFHHSNNNNIHDDDDVVLERLAVACCESGVVPRKEFFETYAAASYIHHHPEFSNIHRIADLAAGHGLLSWMLLVMDDVHHSNSGAAADAAVSHRTAICVDRRMPPSAIAIAKSMRNHFFPVSSNGQTNDTRDDDDDNDDDDGVSDFGLYDSRWTYVETDLKDVLVEDDSTLLVSVHACGTLTDYLMSLGISARAPIAIVPCCHTYSIRKGYTPHPEFSGTTAQAVGATIEAQQKQQQYSTTAPSSSSTINHKFQIVENVIDGVRFRTLQNAGYNELQIASLPQEFTERNRLFLAKHGRRDNDDDSSFSVVSSKPTTKTALRKGSMPPSIRVVDDNDDFVVPLKDDPASIEHCLSVSGTAKSLQRLRALLPNHFAPKLDVSMWLSPPPCAYNTTLAVLVDTQATLKVLEGVLETTVQSYRERNNVSKTYACTIQQINSSSNSRSNSNVFVHPQTGRVGCIYQIEYTHASQDSGVPFPKQTAKELHRLFCENAISLIEGIELR